MLDMHCHILPALDDGAPDIDTTRDMLKRAKQAGITHIVATPHVGRSNMNPPRAEQAYQSARALAQGMGIELLFGYEASYRVLSTYDDAAIAPYCFRGTNTLLIELSNTLIFPNWEVTLPVLAKQYRIIIAHPERYEYIHKDFSLIGALRGCGCELQISADALLGGPFSGTKRTAVKMLEGGLCDYIASDAHRPGDYDAFEKAVRRYGDSYTRKNRLCGELGVR